MKPADMLRTLREREAYLGVRIQAKRSVRRETEYDERERVALHWAIGMLSARYEDDGA